MGKIIAAGVALSNQRSAISQSDHRKGREERKGKPLAAIGQEKYLYGLEAGEGHATPFVRLRAENRSNAYRSSHRRAWRRGPRVRLKAGRSSQCCASRCA